MLFGAEILTRYSIKIVNATKNTLICLPHPIRSSPQRLYSAQNYRLLCGRTINPRERFCKIETTRNSDSEKNNELKKCWKFRSMEKRKGKKEKKSRLFQTALHFGSELSYGSYFSYLPSYRSTQDQIQKKI